VRITVAVCTWNRARSLQRALTSIATAVEAFGHSVQLVVVNNNCTDDTDSVIELLAKRIAVTYVHELRVGLANARNAALRATSGEYIIWTDDDVVVCAGWIAAYAKAFVEYPDATFFGGPIRPLFDMAPPAWLAAGWPKVAGIYACAIWVSGRCVSARAVICPMVPTSLSSSVTHDPLSSIRGWVGSPRITGSAVRRCRY
jgi:glycosyltransferase involved in cell wall biosynthesis